MGYVTRRCIVFMVLVGLLMIFSSCDLLGQKQLIFESYDGSIVVHTANPMPEDIEEDGFTFLVDLDLPSDILDTGDGYRVWIIPKEYSAPDYPGQSFMSPWYYSSSVLSAHSNNIMRGGWLGYVDTNDNYVSLRRGTVESWRLIVDIWDSSRGMNIDYYQGYFDYKVTVL